MADMATSPDTRLQCMRSNPRNVDFGPHIGMYTKVTDGRALHADAVHTCMQLLAISLLRLG